MLLPSPVFELLSGASSVAFSGGRRCPSVPGGLWAAVAAAVPGSAPVSVGCQRGVDAVFRGLFPSASVFRASSFGSGRGSFAARSVAVVGSVSSRGGVFVSFPSAPCPVLLPSSSSSRCFCGSGSGSWASLAFAIGSGVPSAVYLGSLPCPVGWGLVGVGRGWFLFRPGFSQLSLGL